MSYQIIYWQFITISVIFSCIHFSFAAGNYRENLALRHPCTTINKRLEPYIKWTEKLASSQYKVQRDACGQIGSGPACCTTEVMNSYALSYGADLKALLDAELNHSLRTISLSRQKIDVWSKEYIEESHRLTTSSLETLFGAKEYRSNVHQSVTMLFDTLSNNHSSADDVSKSTMDLFNQLILSLYRQFIMNDSQLLLDDKFQKCLINKAFDMEALPAQRELLYTLTSGSSLIEIFRTMLIYLDADIQRFKFIATMNSTQCIHRYAREALCPICVSASASFKLINDDINEILCENDCQYITKTCFNQANSSYAKFASITTSYSAILKDIEQAIVELKLVERLSKLHIYLYDMVVNATNSRHIYTQLQTACPTSNSKPFSPILSLPPTITERREVVSQWNSSLHYLLKHLQSSIDHLNVKFTQQIITDICSSSNYAVKSSQCTHIDKESTNNVIQWPLPSIPPSTINTHHAEMARNQLDELKKKLVPIQQMIISLRPKKKYSLMEYIPDFESYNDDININDIGLHSSAVLETYDNDIEGSLSERLYEEIDGQTTNHFKEDPEQTDASNAQSITYSILIYLNVFILHRNSRIN